MYNMQYGAAQAWNDICDQDDARQAELEEIDELTKSYIELGRFGEFEDQTRNCSYEEYIWNNCEYNFPQECQIFSKMKAAFETKCEDVAREEVQPYCKRK